jgi:hypothetical protein
MKLLQSISLSGLCRKFRRCYAIDDAGVVDPRGSVVGMPPSSDRRVLGAIILASTEAVQYAAADLKYLVTLALQSSLCHGKCLVCTRKYS